jgi:hypothetical protein
MTQPEGTPKPLQKNPTNWTIASDGAEAPQSAQTALGFPDKVL